MRYNSILGGRRYARPATIIPILAVTLVSLLGFVALAIDLGLVSIARTQCQNAADAAALAGARALTGTSGNNNNVSYAQTVARLAVSANTVLGKALDGNDTTNVVVEFGAYAYDPVAGSFNIKLPKGSNDPYSLCRVTITVPNSQTYFARVFNIQSFSTTAKATAAHRPRDVNLILDFSGSMRFGSLLGVPYNGTRNNGLGASSGSNNPESVYPKFGHYSATSSAGLQNTSALAIGNYQYSPANVTESNTFDDNRVPVVQDFYQNPVYTDPDVPAFNNTVDLTGPNPPADSTLDSDNFAGGDKALRLSNNATKGYATNLYDVTGSASKSSSFESNSSTGGYNFFTGGTFRGYTQGPRYWGKTFLVWPPDPRWGGGTQSPDPTKLSTTDSQKDIYGNYVCDWRRRFFGTNDNTKLWNSSTGQWQSPTTGGYTINYNAILAWIKNSGPNPFPVRLHAGHIVYYSAMPSSINTSTFPPTNTDERFWKEYIDNCLGLQQTGSNSWSYVNAQVGYGEDFTWGTFQLKSPPTGSGAAYMDYKDNPKRPRTHFWFGPMTMVDFMGTYNLNRWMWPGDCHEAPLYACKLAIQAALQDAQNNHPNDFMSLNMFSVPKNSSSDKSGRFNTVRVPLGKNYTLMKSSLFFPPSTLNADGSDNYTTVTPYDTANLEVPRAYGGTCYAMGLMLAYNQFQFTSPSDTVLRTWITPSTSIPEGMVGGEGRKGTQKMIIFCTDGAPNTNASATLASSGSVKYYSVRYDSSNLARSEFPSTSSYGDNDPTVTSQIYSIVDQLKADYSTPRNPFRLYTIGFGPDFETSYSGTAAALTTLQTMQYRAGTQTNPSTPLPPEQIVVGNDATMVTDLTSAITKIMQASVQVVLLE
jgi:Flp pilus assembly protein TadG